MQPEQTANFFCSNLSREIGRYQILPWHEYTYTTWSKTAINIECICMIYCIEFIRWSHKKKATFISSHPRPGQNISHCDEMKVAFFLCDHLRVALCNLNLIHFFSRFLKNDWSIWYNIVILGVFSCYSARYLLNQMTTKERYFQVLGNTKDQIYQH